MTPNTATEQPGGKNPGITIIIPVYNEEKIIGSLLDTLQTLRKEWDFPSELIVVDDGSDDGTADILEQQNDIYIITIDTNRGYGAALKTGIRNASYSIICITDGDGTYPSERISELRKRLIDENSDMVVGARTGKNVKIPNVRRPAKWFIGKLASYIASRHIPDINSGLRIFRREDSLTFYGLYPDGFSFTTSITLAFLTNGYQVDYISIDYHGRVGKSKIRPVKDTLNFIMLIFRIGLYFGPLKIFIPISVFLFTLGIAWGIFTKLHYGMIADISTLTLLIASLQITMIGLLAELVNKRSTISQGARNVRGRSNREAIGDRDSD